DLGRLRGEVDLGDLRRDDLRALEVTTVRDDRVTRLDGARGDLRQERLIGHVGQRVDHRDLCLASAQVLLELLRGVETGVAAADDQDLAHAGGSPRWGKSRVQSTAYDGCG